MDQVTISPKKTTTLLVALAIAMGLLNIVSFVPLLRGTRDVPIYMLNLDAEQSIPALFSTVLLWLCAIFAAFIARSDPGKRSYRLKWGGIALAFFFLGIDEALCFHERLNGIFLRDSGILTLGWTLPYAVLAIVFAISYLRFLGEIPKETRNLIIIAGSLYVCGSLVVEVIGGRLRAGGIEGIGYHSMVAMEELLEMSGAIVFIHAFSSYIDKHLPNFHLGISSTIPTEE
ncbi:hypothetical protein PDESU_03359 [Pontiella desulfatans]|uniref:Uncharacterized protein n=1 Tax=Pontiella desulfatans TaxID=2750659 RepID=A0A6C2U488_PONDE|nr:hypothetical protein [Pontiella desulfatans]VGO14790.1 hypothetical protein PDESU_03359 [Pontiella desulfatans]